MLLHTALSRTRLVWVQLLSNALQPSADNPAVLLWYISSASSQQIKPESVASGDAMPCLHLAVWGRNLKFHKGEQSAMRKVLLICLAVCFVFALSALAFDDMGKSATVNGWIVDAKCGVKGANAGGEACTKKCVAAGEKMVVVTDGDQKVLAVENQDALKGHEGHHVAVTGTMGKDSIKVESVKML